MREARDLQQHVAAERKHGDRKQQQRGARTRPGSQDKAAQACRKGCKRQPLVQGEGGEPVNAHGVDEDRDRRQVRRQVIVEIAQVADAARIGQPRIAGRHDPGEPAGIQQVCATGEIGQYEAVVDKKGGAANKRRGRDPGDAICRRLGHLRLRLATPGGHD